ncbi:MAG: hypothetical protein IJ973_06245, partial [Christensenellaceae bacterium]|nr:hypothetical protein [Christensenellaceae bacterium]
LNISNSETWTMRVVNEKFPIRILRKMDKNMFHKFYTVYQVSEGGCYYVFFGLRNNENMNDMSLKLMNDYAYVSFVYYFDGTYADQEKTEKLEVYKHTWQDVYEIDNFMQTWHSGQSTINTEIIIADEETKELKAMLIGYERFPGSLKHDEEGRITAERSDYYIEHIRSEEALDPDDPYCLPLLIYDFDLPEGTPEWAKKYYLHLEE